MGGVWASPYQAAKPPCSGKAQPGTSALAGGIHQYWAASGSDGIYNCRDTAGGARSLHSEGRAFDCHLDLVEGAPNPLGDVILRKLYSLAVPLGIQLIIWNRRIYSERHPWPEGDPYSVPGGDPHTTHLHIEQRWDKALSLNFATVWALLNQQQGEGGEHEPLPPPEEDDMPFAIVIPIPPAPVDGDGAKLVDQNGRPMNATPITVPPPLGSGGIPFGRVAFSVAGAGTKPITVWVEYSMRDGVPRQLLHGLWSKQINPRTRGGLYGDLPKGADVVTVAHDSDWPLSVLLEVGKAA